MAAEERAKTDFTEILQRIERKFDIIDTKWTDQKIFEIKFRTQINSNSDDFNGLCDEWVELFSEATQTVWAKKISNTGPKIRFRKQYQCWTQGGKVVQKELLFDARKCKATLDIKVLTDNPFTRRKNKHIRLGLNVVVKINFIHLHQVDTNEPYAFFVHQCEPQREAPRPPMPTNDRLPQLVAEMVQKGINASPKALQTTSTNKQQQLMIINNNGNKPSDISCANLYSNAVNLLQSKAGPQDQHHHQISEQIQQIDVIQEQQTLQLVHENVQSIEAIKLELPTSNQLQQYTQLVVGDVPEQLLMCQSLMFDANTAQVIHGLPSHFVQLHSPNLHNQQ